MPRKQVPLHYDIRLQGSLGETMLCAFPTLRQTSGARGETVLSGVLPDQAALFGVLAQVEALGLTLLEVRSTSTRAPGLSR